MKQKIFWVMMILIASIFLIMSFIMKNSYWAICFLILGSITQKKGAPVLFNDYDKKRLKKISELKNKND